MARVAIKDVRKNYGDMEVIHGVTIDIKDGEFIVLVGPSGCGKSTLLRMVAGLEAITSGTVEIGARVVNQLEPKDRNVAMVFQNYALYPHMSVFDNMAYGLKIRGLSLSEIEARVKQAADILQLGEYLTRLPRQLSGGQRQRVAMGRAIVREPDVFLFDEPLSNLDAKLRVQMRLEIRKLHQRLGVTSIYVTHDQVEAMTLADRIVVMNKGRAEQIGSPRDVYERPATQYVAGFIGSPSMNFIPARIDQDGQGAAIAGNGKVALPPEAKAHAGREVILGLRPEHLELVPGAGHASLRCSVELVEMLGADSLVHCRLGEGGAPLTLRVNGSFAMRQGETLGLSISASSVHLFDPASGARL